MDTEAIKIITQHGRLTIHVINGCAYLSDLEADGTSGDGMASLINEASKKVYGMGFSKVMIHVPFSDSEHTGRLLDVYRSRYKMKPSYLILERDLNEDFKSGDK